MGLVIGLVRGSGRVVTALLASATMKRMSPNAPLSFQTLTGLYEPSAIVQLPDGRFLVAEDDKKPAFSLVTLNTDGSISSTALSADAEDNETSWKLDDLEGLSIGPSGFIYAITSHSRAADGDQKKSRDKLLRLRIEGDRVVALQVCKGLKPALIAVHTLLADAADILDTKADGGLNIEALAISADAQQLLIGFRSPLFEQRAIIASVDNPAAVFDADAAPRISSHLETLDLNGNGIRDICYFPLLDGYLIISGPVAREQIHFELWFWSGQPLAAACHVNVSGLAGLEHAEGICPAIVDDRPGLIIISDDGSRKAERYGRFLLLALNDLQIEPRP